MRDALGALGPVEGQNPELHNLTCSFTNVEPGDIVFLTSDGVSDNFDPVVGKFALPSDEAESSKGGNSGSPVKNAATVSDSNFHRFLKSVEMMSCANNSDIIL